MVSIPPHFSISTDGFIRMNENQLMSYPLQHIILSLIHISTIIDEFSRVFSHIGSNSHNFV